MEVFTDIDMVLMTEKRIRGVLTQVIRKYGIGNNKYLPNYDDGKKTTYLEYLDANNLYGYAMNKKLPLNGYKLANKSISTDDAIKNYDDDGDKGYLLEVDVEYPKYLHATRQDLPFLPEKGLNFIRNLSINLQKILKRHIKRCIRLRLLILPMNLKTN